MDPSTDNNTYPQFKAREATVLKKKPFIPSLPNKRVEREEFNRKMKLREAELEQQRQHIKEMQAEKEQKERAKCRKLALTREATVLKKKPFIPSLPNKRVEREEFNRKMKLREAELEQQRQHIKEMQAEKEQKERAKCRKLALS
ncbi:unnamed protein product [Ceutorhynchus assimilis]|uniref:Uncharacterized protein n=1 Tax=Ceutorhynchus assimilis TaxID=467358 RepID=A0A9N9N1N0_9CUCU|nr:unnamed protein product [Ceutorhynchus assimilis]